MQTTVYAYSPHLSTEVRMFNLANQQVQPFGAQVELEAQSFCNRLNQQRHMHTADWQPRIKQEDVGIHTIPGYMGSR